MVHLSIGPEFLPELKAVCQYINHRLGLHQCHFKNFNKNHDILVTTLDPGKWTVDNFTIQFKLHETRTTNFGEYMQDIDGYIEAPSYEHIKKFFKAAQDYNDNIDIHGTCENGYIKILTFDGHWELSTTMKKRPFESIKLPKAVLSEFITDIENFSSPTTIASYEKFGIAHSRIYMLHGPPGTGKTSLIQCVASRLNMSLASFTVNSKTDDNDLKRALSRLPKNSIFVLEDIDSLFLKNKDDCLTLSGLLNIFDGLERLKNNLLIFITTNHLNELGTAMKRRIDYFIKFEYCNKQQIRELVERFRPNEDISQLDELCAGMKFTPCALQKFLIQNKPLDRIREECLDSSLDHLYV